MKKEFISVRYLIVAMLACMAFIKGDTYQWIMIGLVSIWILGTLYCRFHPQIKKFIRSQKERSNIKLSNKKTKKEKLKLVTPEIEFGSSEELLLKHINFRITDKLKSAYPNATWSWACEVPTTLAENGGCGRIKTGDTGEYNYAEVIFDSYAEIKFRMLKVVDFTNLNDSVPNEDKIVPNEVCDYDVSSWYNLNASPKLTNIITELNTRGHSYLVVNEDGSIYTSESELEEAVDTLENMPKKLYWEEFSKILIGEGLVATHSNSYLKIEWNTKGGNQNANKQVV